MTAAQQREALTKSHLIDAIARVDLRVQGIDKALGFYRDVVGLRVVERGDKHAELGAGAEVFLRLDSEGVSKPADPTATGLFHTAIRFPTRHDLGDALARLVAAGLEIGAGDHLVSEALYIDDPDGNGVELYWDRPTEQWPAPSGDMLVPMATLPVDLQNLLDEGRGRAAVDESAPDRTDIGHVHLQASDIDQTVAFYTDVVGLDLTARLGSSAGFFSSNGYHHNIGANVWRSRGRSAPGGEHAGLERVVFRVPDVDELEKLSERAGVASSDKSVSLRDPDGIELVFGTN